MTAVQFTRSAILGAAAALVAPWHLDGRRLRRLLDGPTGAGGGPEPAVGGPEPAVGGTEPAAAGDATAGVATAPARAIAPDMAPAIAPDIAPGAAPGATPGTASAGTAADTAAALGPGAAAAVRSSNRLLRALARVPAAPWRNTCLYRAAAGCLALRWLGRPARLRIGTRRDATTGEIVAHAWIEDPAGRIGVGYDGDYRVLSGRARAAS